jgi:hypothetical protein
MCSSEKQEGEFIFSTEKQLACRKYEMRRCGVQVGSRKLSWTAKTVSKHDAAGANYSRRDETVSEQ